MEGREQKCSTSSTWALGHSATTAMLYQRPGKVLLGVSHLGGCKSPSRGGVRCRDTGKVHPDIYRAGGSSHPPDLLCKPQSEKSPPSRTRQEGRHHKSLCETTSQPEQRCHPRCNETRTGTRQTWHCPHGSTGVTVIWRQLGGLLVSSAGLLAL